MKNIIIASSIIVERLSKKSNVMWLWLVWVTRETWPKKCLWLHTATYQTSSLICRNQNINSYEILLFSTLQVFFYLLFINLFVLFLHFFLG